jgi:hypothetical protein
MDSAYRQFRAHSEEISPLDALRGLADLTAAVR